MGVLGFEARRSVSLAPKRCGGGTGNAGHREFRRPLHACAAMVPKPFRAAMVHPMMARRRSLALAGCSLVFSSLLAPACGSGPDGAPRSSGGSRDNLTGGANTFVHTGGVGSGGGSGGGTDDLGGLAGCSSDQGCGCEAPSLTSTQSNGFEPCGGPPFGAWQVTDVDLRGLKLSIFTRNLFNVVTERQCDAELDMSWSRDRPWLQNLREGGSASIDLPGLTGTTQYPGDECSGILCEDTADCDYFPGCDLCFCETSKDRIVSPSGSWSATDNILHLSTGEGAYCVQGDTLKLDTDNGLYVLKRVALQGAPRTCAERSLESCAGTGCHVGECTGDEEKCALAMTDSACSTLQGCSWDDTVCSGEARAVCFPEDWGVAEGCDVISAPFHCEGTPPKCEDQEIEVCEQTPGCHSGVCSGVAGVGCGVWSKPNCGERAAGCSDPEGVLTSCTGDIVCDDQPDERRCDNTSCDWDGSVCGGVPDSCAGLDPDTCQTLPYCKVVPD